MVRQKSTKAASDKVLTLPNVLLALSVLLTLQFVYNICWAAQQYAFYSVENGMKNYNAVVAIILAAYVWKKSEKTYQRYIIVGIVTAIALGYVVWLLGETGVGGYLRNSNGFWS